MYEYDVQTYQYLAYTYMYNVHHNKQGQKNTVINIFYILTLITTTVRGWNLIWTPYCL